MVLKAKLSEVPSPVRVVTLTEAELAALLERAAVAALAHAEPPREILNTEEAADLLRVDPDTVLRWVQKLGLPAHVCGKREYRFRRSELVEWLTKAGPVRPKVA